MMCLPSRMSEFATASMYTIIWFYGQLIIKPLMTSQSATRIEDVSKHNWCHLLTVCSYIPKSVSYLFFVVIRVHSGHNGRACWTVNSETRIQIPAYSDRYCRI